MARSDPAHRAAAPGHSMRTVHKNEKHYEPLTADMADEAWDAVAAWMKEKGIEI